MCRDTWTCPIRTCPQTADRSVCATRGCRWFQLVLSRRVPVSDTAPGGRYFFSSWPPNCLRIAESSLLPKSASSLRREACEQRGRDHRRGHALRRSRRRRPPAFARIATHGRANPSRVGDSWSAVAVRSSSHDATTLTRAARPPRPWRRRGRSGRARVARAAPSRRRVSRSACPTSAWWRMLRPSAYAAIRPYSMPLCTIFTKWPAPAGPQCR